MAEGPEGRNVDPALLVGEVKGKFIWHAQETPE
jgi:hypothetical protein